MGWLKRLAERFRWRAIGERRRAIPVLQVEVTSRCQLGCVYCPRTVLQDLWDNGDLSWEVFERELRPVLPDVELLHLQGWGEPLLHPRLLDMLAAAKEAGCETGFTTNGMLLEPAAMNQLVKMGIDLVCFSLAGAREESNGALRPGSSLMRVLAHAADLAARRREAGGSAPRMVLFYSMTCDNLGEMVEILPLAAAAGIDEVVATNIDFAPDAVVEARQAFTCGPPDPEAAAAVDRARAEASRIGMPFRAYPLSLGEQALMCDAYPTQNVFINHRGEVAPCVYLGLPLRGTAIPRLFCGERKPATAVTFGNVAEGLTQALRSEAAEDFREAFRRRLATRLDSLVPVDAERVSGPRIPSPPAQCVFCYKLYGL
ncbi:MAG: radical SAM/SPASM domain-containing protein [Bacillota bacterium]|nr:radical SAM/SPASM domain-containing protein [Bacillota bacterium]